RTAQCQRGDEHGSTLPTLHTTIILPCAVIRSARTSGPSHGGAPPPSVDSGPSSGGPPSLDSGPSSGTPPSREGRPSPGTPPSRGGRPSPGAPPSRGGRPSLGTPPSSTP